MPYSYSVPLQLAIAPAAAMRIRSLASLIWLVKKCVHSIVPSEHPMSLTNRILLASLVLLLDLVVFFFPITAVFIAYVIIFNPPWLKEAVLRLDKPNGKHS